MDEQTDPPEGTVLDLVLDDEGDNLDDAERAALHEWRRMLDEGVYRNQSELARGEGVSTAAVSIALKMLADGAGGE